MSEDALVEPWLRLLRAPGLSAVACRAALAATGSAAGIVTASPARLAALGFAAPAIAAIRGPDQAQLAADAQWLSQPGRGLLTLDSPGYPARLRELAGAPLALWTHGRQSLLEEPQLAIVGSRNPTHAGRETAHAFAAHLAGVGLVITSGLAIGVDAAAHGGALAAGGDTIAVLGCGLDRIYPPSNSTLARRIAEHGILVSEYPPGSAPKRAHFPARNRIISALSLGVLVVEAARHSGSLITARLAGEQGREVFAVPGSIHNPLARGCHRLIREGAKLVETADDVLSELAVILDATICASPPRPPKTPPAIPRADDPDYHKLLSALEFAPASMDTLAARTGLTAEALSSMLLILELEGVVEVLPGARYVSRVRAS